MTPIPDAQAGPIAPLPKKEINVEDTELVQKIQESCNQLSKDYQDAWDRHIKRLEALGVK